MPTRKKAVIIAREFNARLDYSENSLMELEGILAQLALDLRPAARTDELTRCARCGAVTSGKWCGGALAATEHRDLSGKQFATLTLNVSGNKLFPSMKIHRRLTEGEGRQCVVVLLKW